MSNIFTEPTGKQYPIACKAWFTSDGQITPLSFKFKDDNGELCHVPTVEVLSVESHMYIGNIRHKFDCYIVTDNIKRRVTLLFDAHICRWFMYVDKNN